MDCQVVSSNPTLPKLQEKRVRGDQKPCSGVLSMSVRPPGFEFCPTLLSVEGRRALAFLGSVLAEELVVHQAVKKAPAKKTLEKSSRRLGPRAPASRM